MNDNKPTEVFIRQIDNRAGYRKDEHYPNCIFLATVLRWSITGNVMVGQGVPSDDVIVSHNDCAIDSIAAFLADHIESGQIPIFNVHTRILLGGVEKSSIIKKLRELDGGFAGGLANDAGWNYYIGGYQLFQIIKVATLPSGDDFEKGGVWWRLMFDAPPAWWPPASTESPEEDAPRVCWKERARAIADECFDRDTLNKIRDSLKGYSSRVRDEMQVRRIHGPRGLITNPNTIQRDALQGKKWWEGKTK